MADLNSIVIPYKIRLTVKKNKKNKKTKKKKQ